MATGIPTKKNSSNSTEPILSYPNKMDEQEIFKIPYSPSHIVSTIGNNSDNILYYGDNIDFLLESLKDSNIVGNIKLVYIDPPFSTGFEFKCRDQSTAYDDIRCGDQYVEFLRKRLVLLRELMSDDGSIYLHLDYNMIFQMKIIMDEIFGSKNYRGMITRKKCSNKNSTTKTYGNVSDYILFYSKSSTYVWNRQYEPWDEESSLREYPYIDSDGRRYKRVPIHAPGVRNGETGQPWRGKMPPQGKHWQYTPSKLDELDNAGHIYWSKNGNPRRKVYLDQSEGIPVQNIWMQYRDSINQNDQSTGYPTEKNSSMLERIVKASSNPGDYVLDCFCGSGSILGVASKLNRKWIGADIGLNAIKATMSRLTYGTEKHGDYVTSKKNKTQKLLPLEDNSFVLKTNQKDEELIELMNELSIKP